MIRDRRRFIERVETRLNEAETALFRDAIGSAPGETHGDLADIMTLLDVGSVTTEANSLCSQIRVIEEDVADGLPTVPIQPIPNAAPIVAAVGWGDLIVARESLPASCITETGSKPEKP